MRGINHGIKQRNKQKLLKNFAINPQDTGSTEVQIALLTERY